jgi:hypothetical protein
VDVPSFDEEVIDDDNLNNLNQQRTQGDRSGRTYTANWRDKNVVTSKKSKEGGSIGFAQVSKTSHCTLK